MATKKTAKKPEPIISAESFFTKELSEEGVKVPLALPDGSRTDHWMVLLSTDSDAFKRGCVAVNQRFLKDAGKEQSAAEKLADKEKRNMLYLSLLIKEWSFDEPCTEANKVRVLSNAPALADMVDRFANQRANFFKKPSLSS